MNEIAELMRQHAVLRGLITVCEGMADDLDRDAVQPAEVLKMVAQLRQMFEAHCRYEEHVMRPVIDAAHLDEHHDATEHLGSPMTNELRATLARLRHHLDSEDRYFSSQETSHEPARQPDRRRI